MTHVSSRVQATAEDGGVVGAMLEGADFGQWKFTWTCEKWDQDKVDFVLAKLVEEQPKGNIIVSDGTKEWRKGTFLRHNISGRDVWRPIEEGCPSDFLRAWGIDPDDVVVVEGNLLLNEGIAQLWDLGTAALSNQVAANPFSNGNSFIGIGDSTTAEAATQTDLSAATNHFYKGMNASYPIRTAQSVDWRSDFTTTEANYAWQEWTISAGATGASGAGFTTGTKNLNRKVQSLGTKTTGTWTMTGTVTLS